MNPRLFVRAAALATVVLGAACTSTPAAESPSVAVIAAPGGAVSPDSFPPVAPPAELGGVFRLGSPLRDLVVWRDLVPADTGLGKLLAAGPETVARRLLGSLGAQIDFSQPIDLLTHHAGEENRVVVSMALRDLAAAREAIAADFETRPGSDGSLVVAPRPGKKSLGIFAKKASACRVYQGGDPVRAHLVCAMAGELVEKAGPYLARTVSRWPVQPGLHMELPEEVLARILGEQRAEAAAASAEPEEDSSGAAGRRLGRQWGEQLGADLASAGLDMAATPKGVTLGADLRFRAVRGAVSVAVVGTKGTGVPAAFWNVPADAELALYLPGAPPDAMKRSIGTLWSEFAEAMSTEDLSRETWRKVAAQLGDLLFTGGPVMVARGPSALGAKGPDAALHAKRFEDARAALAGWTLLGTTEPATHWVSGLRNLLKLVAPATPSGASAKATGATPTKSAAAPAAGTQKKYANWRTLSSDREVPIAPSEGLPAGTLHIVHREVPNPNYAPRPGGKPPIQAAHEVHLYVGGTADVVWLSISEVDATSRAKLHDALAGGAGIGGRADLAPLRSMPAGGVGFATLGAILSLLSGRDTAPQLAIAVERMKRATELPSTGSLPMFVSIAPSPRGDGGATVHVSADLSIGAALDVIHFLQSME